MSIFTRKKDLEIARLRAELTAMSRQVDDLLDRESMHVYDPDMERLATAPAIERYGAQRARHGSAASPRRTATPTTGPKRPDLKVLAGNVTELTITAPRIDHGVWEGFTR
ncbi:hypothetical protein AB0J47_39865 [Nocardia sp. NPDC049737]|uniref:hypothetical protein n=1 Tax=Nocardia sp. NPDC049737 TaxID=3154358 RepID=UPI0034188056